MSATPYLDAVIAAGVRAGRRRATQLPDAVLDAAADELAALRADAELGRLVREAARDYGVVEILEDNGAQIEHADSCPEGTFPTWKQDDCTCGASGRVAAIARALAAAEAAAEAAHAGTGGHTPESSGT